MEDISVIAKIGKIMFPKNVSSTEGGFTILSMSLVETLTENYKVELNKWGSFSIKGDMPPIEQGKEYKITMKESERHPVFGMSYELQFLKPNTELNVKDKNSVKNFLKVIMTERQVKAIFEVFDDPMSVIEEGNIEKLTEVNGVGKHTANRIIEHYEMHKDYSEAYIVLGKYGITQNAILKLIKNYKSTEKAINIVETDPYQLMKIDGYGFKKCDEIYKSVGGDPNSIVRINAFLYHCLNEEASAGNTWVEPRDIMTNVLNLIPNADKSLVGKLLKTNEDFIITEDKRIALSKYYNLEKSVASHIHRLMSSKSNVNLKNLDKVIEKTQESQGWEFTAEQNKAIHMMNDNNVFILQGYGGTGKTSAVKAFVDALSEEFYLFAQSALSGKAGMNLTLATGREGQTIHRLLGFGMSDEGFGFAYNSKNKMPYDVIIVDEISMVDANILNSLLEAMRDGSKLIMLGDSEQLESIGVPVMIPFIESDYVPTMTLTEIHRQAQKSAVVTDSIKIRKGQQIIKETEGRFVHGELEDLEYLLLPDDDKIFIETVKEFNKSIKNEDIRDVQVLTQTRASGKVSCMSINKACQKIYNPSSDLREDFLIKNSKDDSLSYYLREGDKVINTKNNYRSEQINGEKLPVFNGSIGILEEINREKDDKGNETVVMIIDFEGIGRIVIKEKDFKSIELAYCITTHKSQGSAFKIVIIALPFHYMLNTRQLLYTAITRTREHCILVSTKRNISSAIRKNDIADKRTFLSKFLEQKYCNS